MFGVVVDGRREVADADVPGVGQRSRKLALDLGLDLPAYLFKGDSFTIPVSIRRRAVVDDHGPDLQGRGHVLREPDSRRRHGRDRGFDLGLNPRGVRRSRWSSTASFPVPAIWPTPSSGPGLRPMTPYGTPIVGATRYSNCGEHRGRHAGLDDGRRIGTDAGGPDHAPSSGDLAEDRACRAMARAPRVPRWLGAPGTRTDQGLRNSSVRTRSRRPATR